MTVKQIKQELLNGKNFGNDAANWYSLCKPIENIFLIVIGERNLFCKNIDSAARRIYQLMKRGY
jgi:hypothetical protein